MTGNALAAAAKVAMRLMDDAEFSAFVQDKGPSRPKAPGARPNLCGPVATIVSRLSHAASAVPPEMGDEEGAMMDSLLREAAAANGWPPPVMTLLQEGVAQVRAANPAHIRWADAVLWGAVHRAVFCLQRQTAPW